MADCWEGTVDALVSALNGVKVPCEVTGPLPQQRVASYWGCVEEGKTAIIEMAKANGMHLLPVAQRNPLVTTTLGTGEMMKQALDQGVTKMIIGLGGSVTNDAGAGMAQALGVKFYDADDLEVPLGGGQLHRIKRIDLTGLDPRLKQTEIIIASDVNILYVVSGEPPRYLAPRKGQPQTWCRYWMITCGILPIWSQHSWISM